MLLRRRTLFAGQKECSIILTVNGLRESVSQKEYMKERLLLIDANSLIHRAYHALPPLSTPKGEMVNAVYGFLSVLFKAIKEFQPTYISAAFDVPAPTKRHKIFKEYKATREKAPDELYNQFPLVKEALSI